MRKVKFPLQLDTLDLVSINMCTAEAMTGHDRAEG